MTIIVSCVNNNTKEIKELMSDAKELNEYKNKDNSLHDTLDFFNSIFLNYHYYGRPPGKISFNIEIEYGYIELLLESLEDKYGVKFYSSHI